MSKAKLKNAPLKEVIFELHWNGSVNFPGMPFDAGFELAVGKFAERLKPDFPVHKPLFPDGVPVKPFGVPLHQYWKGELVWPVVQHGQGMIAVNEVEQGYEWERGFKPLVFKSVERIMESYESSLVFNRVKLQYIDAYDLDEMSPFEFIEQNLQTKITAPYQLSERLRNLNVLQVFELEDKSSMQLNITNGINNQNQKQSVIWTTTTEKLGKFNFADIVDWLEMAHTETSKMFQTMLNPEFYASLDE
jgi:uncharacterized protein (TIGR04255 family)